MLVGFADYSQGLYFKDVFECERARQWLEYQGFEVQCLHPYEAKLKFEQVQEARDLTRTRFLNLR